MKKAIWLFLATMMSFVMLSGKVLAGGNEMPFKELEPYEQHNKALPSMLVFSKDKKVIASVRGRDAIMKLDDEPIHLDIDQTSEKGTQKWTYKKINITYKVKGEDTINYLPNSEMEMTGYAVIEYKGVKYPVSTYLKM